MCNPIENLCDKIASHVRDRERDLIERLAAALADMREVVPQHVLPWNHAAKVNADAVLAEADAWLAEPPVKVEIDAAYGTVK